MPKIGDNTESHNIGGNFTFTAARLDSLGATEYTLVDIVVDDTGSTRGFSAELRNAVITALEACKKSPQRENLLVRVTVFSSYLGGVVEWHGYKPLAEIDPASYPQLQARGETPLYDATYSAVGSMAAYGKMLKDDDYLVNGIIIIPTDGAESGCSKVTTAMIKQELADIRQGEKLESVLTILVGINAAQYQQELEDFQKDAGLDQYIDAGDATPEKLAKLAEFVSQSISSQSQALGTGGPSQAISTTI